MTFLLLFSIVTFANAGIPGDLDGDTYISKGELSGEIIKYMVSEHTGKEIDNPLSKGALSIAANSYLSPGDGELNAVLIFFEDSLDPGNGWVGWYVRTAGIYETLVSLDENAQLVPELATGWSHISSTEWEISLRQDVTFHDGTPFNADAVIYSLNRVLDPDNSRHGEYEFIQSVSKADDYTVIITTKEPYAPTMASLVDPLCSIISPALIDPQNNAAGTGPFMLQSWEPKTSISVVKNSKYWGGNVKLHNANIQYNTDPIARALMLESGDVDMTIGIPAPKYDDINNNPNLEMCSKETLRDYFIFVNTGKAPLDNKSVRQAINYAMDRQQIVDTALEGVGGVPAKSIFPSVMPWSANNRGLQGYQYNREKALELLTEAGITDTDGDGWLDYNGDPLELKIETYSGRAACPAASEVIKTQLEDVGIKVTVEVLGISAIKEHMNSGEYDLAMYSYGVGVTGDPDYILNKFAHAGSKEAGWCRYSNPQVDEWIEQGRRCMNEDDRQAIYDNIQEQLIEDSPQIYVFSEKKLTGKKTSVGGYRIYPNEITVLTPELCIAG